MLMVPSAPGGRSPLMSALDVGELPRPLVEQQRLDDEVEVAGQHVGQPVHREPDPVVGDPALLEVVGADLLAAAAATDDDPIPAAEAAAEEDAMDEGSSGASSETAEARR